MGNPILGERVRGSSGVGGGRDGLPHVEGAHGLACVCVCVRARLCRSSHECERALACERAQGLNFNYFLFGRYNISMLGGAWPTGLASRRHLCQVMLL